MGSRDGMHQSLDPSSWVAEALAAPEQPAGVRMDPSVDLP
jgi:hypothetical protein